MSSATELCRVARPRAFDETQALEAAMDCFWERGYKATSVRDLTERMGIAGPSLYNAFSDKRSLFSCALEQYCSRLTYARIERIEAQLPPHARIAAFLAEVVDKSVDDQQRRGCFLINSAIDVAPHDAELGAIIAGHLEAVRRFFERSLLAARQVGSVATGIDCSREADHLMAVLLGIRVLARTRPERSLLEGIVEAALAPLGLASPVGSGHGRQKRQPAGRGQADD